MLETIGQADRCIAVWSQRVNKPAKNPLVPAPLSPDLLEKMDACWRAANYLAVGQIYLQDNPMLETALKIEHIKPRLRSRR
jgi:xylulose-5-phosphate/fructose-6-phosphate phosphoketolase